MVQSNTFILIILKNKGNCLVLDYVVVELVSGYRYPRSHSPENKRGIIVGLADALCGTSALEIRSQAATTSYGSNWFCRGRNKHSFCRLWIHKKGGVGLTAPFHYAIQKSSYPIPEQLKKAGLQTAFEHTCKTVLRGSLEVLISPQMLMKQNSVVDGCEVTLSWQK